MSTPTCPKCKRALPAEEINVATDVAYCRSCGAAHKLSALVHGAGLTENLDLRKPPQGAWFESDNRGAVVGATHRSLGAALGLLGISLFWNGIVSVFVVINLASSLKHMGLTLPEWFPAPQGNGFGDTVGMTLFMWLFLTPFIVIGLGMAGAFLLCLAGHTEVRMKGSEGVVFTGIGPLGYRRRFDPAAVTEVRIDDHKWSDSEGGRQQKTEVRIETQSGKVLKFGSMLTEERRKFVAAAVRLALVP